MVKRRWDMYKTDLGYLTNDSMDYSKFMDDDFDVKEWVNSAFRSQKEGSKDQYATTLVMRLQMFIQEVNNVVEDSCQQAIQNLPRVQRELEAVRQEAALLQDQMTAVRTDIQKVEHDTAQSMQMLLQLDTIKSRMKAASDALQEADNWTTLSADVEEVFDSQDIQAISAKLVGMQQSLQVLTDVPDYTERCQYLETLKNRLEAMLSPQLVAAFNTQSVEGAQTYVKIFTDIDRLSQLCKYYHTCRKGQLLQKWRSIQEDRSDETLVEWLNDFYDTLLETWHTQIGWCSQLFEEPVPLVCHLLSDSLLGMDPSLASCITAHLQMQSEPLPALIHLKMISERFGKSIEGAIENFLAGKPSGKYTSDFERLSASVYVAYQPYVSEYSALEEAVLLRALEGIPLDHSEIIDCVRLLADSVSKVFAAAKQANERCVQLTNGCGYVSLLGAVKSYFTNYLCEFRRVLSNLREKCQPENKGVDVEDWSCFQHSLRVIQTCGDLLVCLDELDQTLVADIIHSVGTFCQPFPASPLHGGRGEGKKLSPFVDYGRLLLETPAERLAVESVFTGLEEGDTPSVLDEVKLQMCSLSEAVHKFAFDIVFAPLRSQLSDVPTMDMWTSETAGGALASDLPNFSLSPQEYITKVGQYLLTLPQQLEPFTLQDNPALIVALKYGKLPHTSQQEVSEEHLADLWLESVAQGTMHTYCEQVLKIAHITKMATRQLVTDVDYLANVLEDLGLPSSDTLKDMVTLLQATEENYTEVSENMPQRLVSAIAKMRSLNLE